MQISPEAPASGTASFLMTFRVRIVTQGGINQAMGRTYLFECPRCEYRVAVAGGVERGLLCEVQTMRCRDCSALLDVPIRVRTESREVPRSPALGRSDHWQDQLRRRFTNWHLQLPIEIAARDQWVTLKPRCPVSPIHRVEPWTHPGKCPRCAVHLDRTVMPYRLWE
jgi:phage FluMu protein Com